MATNPAVQELYPFSTSDGQSIPLDVISPIGLIKKNFTGVGVSTLVVADSFKIASFYSFEGCILQMAGSSLANPPVDGSDNADTLLILPDTTVVSAIVAGTWNIVPYVSGVAGVLWVQKIRKWAGLALERQLINKN